MRDEIRKKTGRPSAGKRVTLHVSISAVVDKAFRAYIGDDRVLCRAVEKALLNEVQRGSVASSGC